MNTLEAEVLCENKLPSKGFLELGQRSGPQQGDTGGRRVCRADNVSRQAAPGSQSMGGTRLLG